MEGEDVSLFSKLMSTSLFKRDDLPNATESHQMASSVGRCRSHPTHTPRYVFYCRLFYEIFLPIFDLNAKFYKWWKNLKRYVIVSLNSPSQEITINSS